MRKVYGVVAEFGSATDLQRAVSVSRAQGYTYLDAYSPFPIEGLAGVLGFQPRGVAPLVLGAGVLGALSGYGLQYYCAALSYPLNIGGRPLNSVPAFIPITFELAVLFAAFAAVLSVVYLNHLPEPYHPLFQHASFLRASQDRFFLCVRAQDKQFDSQITRQFFKSLGASEVFDVFE